LYALSKWKWATLIDGLPVAAVALPANDGGLGRDTAFGHFDAIPVQLVFNVNGSCEIRRHFRTGVLCALTGSRATVVPLVVVKLEQGRDRARSQ